MKRSIIAATMAFTLALTTVGAAPAYAGDRDSDLAKFLAGFTALVIIGAALDDHNNKKKKRKNDVHRYQPYQDPAPKYVPRQRTRNKVLPGYCMRRVETQNGSRRLMGGRCLRNNYDFANRLPSSCKRDVRTDRGVRRGYSPKCLKRNGYEIARN